jgi:hypothetical protein
MENVTAAGRRRRVPARRAAVQRGVHVGRAEFPAEEIERGAKLRIDTSSVTGFRASDHRGASKLDGL